MEETWVSDETNERDDVFGGSPVPLSLDQRAMAILDDIAASLPYDGGDALDGFVDELIDEGEALRNIVRVLLNDPIAAQRLLSIKAMHFAYAEAQR